MSGSSGKRAAVYLRISADREGKALGVKRQEEDARALVERRGFEVAETYRDNDVSAVAKRPDWDRLLADVAAGRVDAVIAYSSSRLYRDVDVEKGRLFKVCRDQDAKGHRVAIETVASGTIDPYTADGEMLANIMASVDQGERARIRERVLRKRAEKAANGEFQGGYRPFGFNLEGKHLVVNEREARLIRRAATDVLAGVSVSSIARRWNEKGVRTTGRKPWTKGHVKQVLGAERNVPEVLTASDHERVTGLFDDRRSGRAHDRFLLTGILVCARCGGRMQGRGGKYVCLATGEMHLSAVAESVNETVVDQVTERPDREVPEARDPAEPLVQQREEVVRKMEALGDSDLPEPVIRGRAKKLQRELDAVDAEIEATRPRGVWADLYKRAEEFDERVYIEGLVERVVLYPASPGNRWDPERVQVEWR